MISMILTGIGILLVTILIRYITFRTKKFTDFWVGTTEIVVICILGILSGDPDYYAGILGYIIGDEICRYIGWSVKKA